MAKKGYLVSAYRSIKDPDKLAAYAKLAGPAFAKYGARYLVRGGTREVVEGKVRGRTVVLEFPSYQAAHDCYRSPEYQAAIALRKDNAKADIVVVEGYDGPQS